MVYLNSLDTYAPDSLMYIFAYILVYLYYVYCIMYTVLLYLYMDIAYLLSTSMTCEVKSMHKDEIFHSTIYYILQIAR